MWPYFLVERHLGPMMAIAAALGDDLINIRPDTSGGNSAYQIVFHSCGMLEWWTRSAILGLDVARDRDAEFTATGTVAELEVRVRAVTEQLSSDLEEIELDAPLRGEPSADYAGTPIARSAHGVMLHILEELAQHHGHLELTRDVILGSRDR